MKIYEKTKRFDRITGKPIEEWAFKENRCDFTGVVLEEEYCSYPLDYDSSDPCFGAGGDEYEFGKKFSINMHEFLSEPYRFQSICGEFHAEHQMMVEALKDVENADSPWHGCYTFDSMCRAARIITAKELIADGVITPDQLKGE